MLRVGIEINLGPLADVSNMTWSSFLKIKSDHMRFFLLWAGFCGSAGTPGRLSVSGKVFCAYGAPMTFRDLRDVVEKAEAKPLPGPKVLVLRK